jgi:hypothetical protein
MREFRLAGDQVLNGKGMARERRIALEKRRWERDE